MIPRLFVLALLPALLPLRPAEAACGSVQDRLPAPYDALVRGEVALDAGRPIDAIAALEPIRGLPEGPAARRRSLLLGRARLSAGVDGATEALRAALLGVEAPGTRVSPCDADPAEARFWLAAASPEGARVAIWRTLWTANPTSPRSAEAEARLRRADPTFAADVDLALARAATLASMQQHREALALLLARVPQDGSRERALLLARARMRAKDYEGAITAFSAIDPLPATDRFDQALAASRLGRYDEAARGYRALVDEHREDRSVSRPVDGASYKLGYLDYDRGRLDDAIRAFDEHLQRFPASRHATEALWFTGWSEVRLGRLVPAEIAFARLLAQHPRSTLVPGARYWAARIAGLRGEPEAEAAGLEQVLARHPTSSYAFWASLRLGRRRDPPPPPEAPAPSALDDDPVLAVALTLQRAGLRDWAAAELAGVEGRARGREARLTLAERLGAAGQWAWAARLARPWCGAPEQRGDLRALRLCWPRPEGERARAAAKAGGLPPNLPFAIMRAESGFDPGITSPAGARGLMQLMPELGARRWSGLHPGEELTPDALFDPAINVELGVSELLALRRGFADAAVDPVVPLVIAGYNGGAPAVRRWLKAEPSPIEADRFAEDIGYSETRRYVRRVLGGLEAYRCVYGDEAP